MFGLISQALQNGLSREEINYIVDAELASVDHELESQWVDNGWEQAFWVHVAPRAAPQDMDDPRGELRDFAIASMLKEAPLPARIVLPTVSFRENVVEADSLPPVQARTFNAVLKRLMSRRTRRYFRSSTITTEQLLCVLNSATYRLRTNRSYEQGQQRPRDVLRSFGCWLEVGVVVFNVEGLEPGLYRFDISRRRLELLREESLRDQISQLLWRQPAPLTASYTVALFVDFGQAQWRYRHQRALRNVFIELGRIGQSLINAGAEIALDSFCTPAIHESAFAALFGVDPLQLYPAYTITQGP